MLLLAQTANTVPEPGPSVIEWATFGVACFAGLMALASLLVGVWQQRRDHENEARAFLRAERLKAYTEMLIHQNNTAASALRPRSGQTT